MAIREDLLKVALAGLLHDLGKVYQRAGIVYNNNGEEYRDTQQEFDEDNLHEYFGYKHSFITYRVLHDFNRPWKRLLNLFFRNNENPVYNVNEIIALASLHHIINRNNQDIDRNRYADYLENFAFLRNLNEEDFNNFKKKLFSIIIGDRWSSTERIDAGGRTRFLYPIFSQLFNNDNDRYNKYYKVDYIEELNFNNIEDVIFPQDNQNLEDTHTYYENLIENLEQEINDIITLFNRDQITFSNDFIFYKLLTILKKYLFFVPSYTNANLSDISLFSHIKSTTALAVNLYSFFNTMERDNWQYYEIEPYVENNFSFILLQVEFSGIQNFIYNIYRGEGEKEIENLSIAKLLRGRSVFVNLLTDYIAKQLLNEFELPYTNILYSGGGGFQIILPYSNDIINTINEFLLRKKEVLIKKFKGTLILNYAYVIVRGYDFKYNYPDAINILYNQLDIKKKQKISDIENIEFNINLAQNNKLCPICRKEYISENRNVCNNCSNFNTIGNEIIENVNSVLFYTFDEMNLNNVEDINIKSVNFNDLFRINFIKINRRLINQAIYDINSAIKLTSNLINNNLVELTYLVDFNNSFDINNNNNNNNNIYRFYNSIKYIANKTPKYSTNDEIELLNKLNPTSQDREIGYTITFEDMSYLSEGYKKLGIFRADVDNLGVIFAYGLDKELYSISRIATLSELIDIFFSVYTNYLITKDEDFKYIYTVYSGGDDLFYLGPHNQILKYIKELKDKFKKYVVNNPYITFSGGLAIVNGKLPIYKMAEYSSELENIGKSYNKNGLGYFEKKIYLGSSLDTTEEQRHYYNRINNIEVLITKIKVFNLERLEKYAKRLIEFYNKGEISKSILYRLLDLHKNNVTLKIFYKNEDYNNYVQQNGNKKVIELLTLDIDGDNKEILVIEVHPKLYPMVYYLIGRNTKENSEARKFLIDKFFNKEKVLNLYYLDVIIQHVLLNIRK